MTIGSSAPAPQSRLLASLYMVNLSLLVAHEVESAYWQEWRLFSLPGGVQLFTLLHIPLLLLLLRGLVKVVSGGPGGRGYSLALAAAGIACFGIHSAFLLAGKPGFRPPASLLILGAILVGSVALFIVAAKEQPRGHAITPCP